MKYAFTITSNNTKINSHEELFRVDMLRYIQMVLGYDVDHLEFEIENSPPMGYHVHGVFERYVKPVRSYKEYFLYQKPIKNDVELSKWRWYMSKEVRRIEIEHSDCLLNGCSPPLHIPTFHTE